MLFTSSWLVLSTLLALLIGWVLRRYPPRDPP